MPSTEWQRRIEDGGREPNWTVLPSQGVRAVPAASKPSKLGMQREHANMGRKGRTMVATIHGRSHLSVEAQWVERSCEAPEQTGEHIMVLRAERLAVQQSSIL